MDDELTGLENAVADLRLAWTGGAPSNAAQPALELTRAELVRVTEALGALGRQLDTVRAQVAAGVAHESRPELGADSLAKQQGYRNAAALLAATTGSGAGDSNRQIMVGKAIQGRTALTGEPLPAKHPHVAAAMRAGTLTQAAAALIIGMLDKVSVRSTVEDRDAAELLLVQAAPGLSLDQVRKLVAQAEAYLDPDGVEPAERNRRSEEFLRVFEHEGFLKIDGQVEIAHGAPVKAAIDAIVSYAFRHARDDVITGDDDQVRPSIQRLQAEALVHLAEHALGCDDDRPTNGVTVVVRMDLETLQDGIGLAQIDGITKPISAVAARHCAAAADIIPAVLDGKGEVLDWGRVKRLFTFAQRMLLVERDGGCAMCNLPPGMTKAHHLRWWARDHGETNIDEGVLLCESCHHRIHDNGWDIEIEGHGTKAKVWFIPPATVDPARTSRLGGRARFEYNAA